MKLVYCIVALVVCFSKTVFGARTVIRPKEIVSLVAEKISYGDRTYLDEGAHKKISCRGSHKDQKIEWYDSSGELVKRDSTSRVYVQEHLAPSLKSKAHTLVLVFTHAAVKDSGVWECRSDGLVEEVPICVLEPATFIETPEEVTMDGGRSITLSCQSRGDPEPKIQWYRNGELISEEDDEKISISMKYNQRGYEGLLTIKSLTAEDDGQYLCEAVQEVPGFSDCGYINSINVTLRVNVGPEFATKVDPVNVFSPSNESVGLICLPKAYPKPKFRWFREIGDMLTEYSDKQFKVSDDGTESMLTLIANSSTFEQKYRCLATNDYGEAVQNYFLLELTEPAMLSEIEVINATDNMLAFNVSWNPEDGIFPVWAFDIQYLEKRMNSKPKESQWRKAKVFGYALNQSIFEYDDIIVPLPDLQEETNYWIRIRAVNELGDGPWSHPIVASTVSVEEALVAEDRMSDPPSPYHLGLGLGLLLTAVIVLFAGVCIFIIKKL